MKLKTDWNDCPPEIMCIIFKQLDINSLTKCVLVNRKWKDVAFSIAESYNLWETMVKYEMPNKGTSFIYKSRLNWKNIYKNFLLWRYVKTAQIEHLKTYDVQGVKKINVYNGMFITIDGARATYYDMNTFQMLAQLNCVDVAENDNTLALLTQDKNKMDQINLCVKRKKVLYPYLPPEVYHQNDILMFKLEGDSCYSVSKENVVRVLKHKDNDYTNVLLGRCYTSNYDPIVDIHIWNEAGFLITKWGTIWSFTSLTSGLQKVYKMNAPHNVVHYDWVMFEKFSSVIPVTKDNNERVTIQYNEDSDAIMLQCVEVTAAMAHDDVLLLGYYDGRVEIHLPRKNMKSKDPERYFYIQELCICDEDCAIVALNVYEIENSHILFVSTNKRVFQFYLTYPEHIL